MNDHQAVAREILDYIEGRIPLANSRDEQQAIETIAAILSRHYGDLRAAAEPDIVQSLAELATIAGNFWDDIDPDEYISTLRSESEWERLP